MSRYEDTARELAEAATPGRWTAYRMVHADRGDALSPDELGEYVKNSVIKSAAESGTEDFLAIRCQKPDGPADVGLIGNGPTSPANARLIAAHSPDVVRALAEVVGAARLFREAQDDGGYEVRQAYERALRDALARLDAVTGGGR